MQTKSKSISLVTISLLLSACGGGGGGGGTVPTTPPSPTFTSWSAVQPNSTVTVNGLSFEVNTTVDPNTGLVTNVVTPSAVSVSSSITSTFDANGLLTRVDVTTPTTSLSFNEAAGDFIIDVSPDVVGAATSTGTAAALFANPFGLGWNYQTFGVWGKQTGVNSGTDGAMSVGAPTPGSSIPTIGSATFTGSAGGEYVSASGESYLTVADLTVNANFATRALNLTTMNTQITQDLSTFTAYSGLNLSGNLSYAAGTNRFEGSVSSSNGLTGNSTGQFYGPNAQELGGVFFLEAASGIETYGGAYGAIR